MKSFDSGLEELQKLIDLPRQQWLLGAGASFEAGIPLMYPLTRRVRACIEGENQELLDAVVQDLPDDAHIEHVLSHLGDLIALASRSKSLMAKVGDNIVPLEKIQNAYQDVVKNIATTVRYGYREGEGSSPEEIGTSSSPLVDISDHVSFVRQLFKRRANLESRSQVGFITTNYDTLLEDALALEKRVALDGFSGGAIAYWDGLNIVKNEVLGNRFHRVLKLHGSVDWFLDKEAGLLRARYGVRYLADLANTLIYPQATKYLETQKDPFARIFDCFRQQLRSKDGYLLGIVGYSFGDDHINSEIKAALEEKGNSGVVVAFSREADAEHGAKLPPTLQSWLENELFGSRVYVATNKALYNGKVRLERTCAEDLTWWTFRGLSRFLDSGATV